MKKAFDYKYIYRNILTVPAAILIASATSSGTSFEGYDGFILGAVLMTVLNCFLKPLMLVVSLPLIILTLGLGAVFINALLFMLVSALIDGFAVGGFFSALWPALVLGVLDLAAMIYSGELSTQRMVFQVGTDGKGMQNKGGGAFGRARVSRKPRESIEDDDVIDI